MRKPKAREQTEAQSKAQSRRALLEETFGPSFPEKAEDCHFFGSSGEDYSFKETLSKASILLHAANSVFERAYMLKTEFTYFQRLLDGFLDQTALPDGSAITADDVRQQLRLLKQAIMALPRPPQIR